MFAHGDSRAGCGMCWRWEPTFPVWRDLQIEVSARAVSSTALLRIASRNNHGAVRVCALMATRQARTKTAHCPGIFELLPPLFLEFQFVNSVAPAPYESLSIAKTCYALANLERQGMHA
jgi:hypothetical protein